MFYIIELMMEKDHITSGVFDSVISVSLKCFAEASALENFNSSARTMINHFFCLILRIILSNLA